MLLNTVDPFTLCKLAQNYPIARQCANIVERFEKSANWCTDCWMRNANEEVGQQNKKVWDDRWRRGTKWSGESGERGQRTWKDDIPQ
jgi:hypothetical protein